MNKLRLLIAIIRYLRDPNQVDSVLKLGNIFASKAQTSDMAKRHANPEVTRLITERYGLADFPLNELGKLAPGTLGFEYASLMRSMKLNPTVFNSNNYKNEDSNAGYLVARIRKTHDLWHVMTGFNTSQEDEAGLIAFYYAQMRSPLSALIVGLSFIHFLFRRPSDLPELFERITRGWTMGNKARPLIAVRWEEMWSTPVTTLRKELHILIEHE